MADSQEKGNTLRTDAEHIDHTTSVAGHAADQEDHDETFTQAFSRHKKACFWCFYACWTIILVAFDTQAAGAVIGIPQFRKDFGYQYGNDWVIPASWQSAFSGAPTASAVIFSLLAGDIADRIGRKATLAIALAISFGAVGMEFAATTNALFFGGKLLNGVAIGLIVTIMISYISDIAPLRLRGFFTCFIGVAYGIGPLVAFIVVNYTGQSESRWAYRTVFCCQFGFSAVATAFLPFMPESPWWLASKGRVDKTVTALRALGNTPEQAEKKVALIQLTLEEIRRETEGVTYAECFRKSNLRRTIISIMPLCIQSFSGIAFVAGYFTYYLQLAGYSTEMSFKIQIAQPVLSIVGNLMAAGTINYIGGRNLTFYGLGILTVFLLITGGLGLGTERPVVQGTVAFILIYSWWYNVSIGSTAFGLLSETSTSRLRVKTIAIGYAVANSINVMWQFVIPFMFNPDKANLGAKIAFIFGGLCFFCLLYLFYYQPETTGRSYQELDEMFAKGVPARKFKSYRTEAEIRNEAAAAVVDSKQQGSQD